MAFEHLRQKVKSIQETPAGKELFIGEVLNQGSYGKGFYDIKYFDTKYENVPIMASSNGLSTGSDIKDGGTVFCGYVNRQPIVLEPGDEYVNGTVVPYVDETDINFYYPWQQNGNEDTFTYSSFYSNEFADPLDVRLSDLENVINFENMVSADLGATASRSCKVIPIRRNGVITYYDCFFSVNDNYAILFEQKTLNRCVWKSNLPKPSNGSDSYIYTDTFTANIITYRSPQFPNIVALSVRILKDENNTKFVIMLDYIDTNTGSILKTEEYYFNESWYDYNNFKFRCSKLSEDGSGCFAIWFRTENKMFIITQKGLIEKDSEYIDKFYNYSLPYPTIPMATTEEQKGGKNYSIFNEFWDNKIVYFYYRFEDVGSQTINGYEDTSYKYLQYQYSGYFDILTQNFFEDYLISKPDLDIKKDYVIGTSSGFKTGYHKRYGYAPDDNYLKEISWKSPWAVKDFYSNGDIVFAAYTIDPKRASQVKLKYKVIDSNCSVFFTHTSKEITQTDEYGIERKYILFSIYPIIEAHFAEPDYIQFKYKFVIYYENEEIFFDFDSITDERIFAKINNEYKLCLTTRRFIKNPLDIQVTSTSDIVWSSSYLFANIYLLNEDTSLYRKYELLKFYYNNSSGGAKYNRTGSLDILGSCIERNIIDGYEKDKTYLVLSMIYSQNLLEHEDYDYVKLKYISINLSDNFEKKVFLESISNYERFNKTWSKYLSDGIFQKTLSLMNGILFFNNRKLLCMYKELDYNNFSTVNYYSLAFLDITKEEISKINTAPYIVSATNFGIYNNSGYKIDF